MPGNDKAHAHAHAQYKFATIKDYDTRTTYNIFAGGTLKGLIVGQHKPSRKYYLINVMTKKVICDLKDIIPEGHYDFIRYKSRKDINEVLDKACV